MSNTQELAAKDLNELQLAKEETNYLTGKKSSYISDNIKKYYGKWWKDYLRMRKSKNATERRTAFIEFNKLQQKVLPTQFETEDGQQIMVNIIGMGLQAQNQDPIKVQDESVVDEQ